MKLKMYVGKVMIQNHSPKTTGKVAGFRRITALVLCACCLSACSLKMMYNNADRFVRWQVNDYVELNAEQKKFLNTQIKDVLDWHRNQHLPLYSEYFLTLSQQVTDEVSPERVKDIIDQFILWGEEIELRSMPAAIGMLASLTDEQIAALPERLAEDNRKFAEDEMDKPLGDIQSQWAGDFTDALERFTGRLDRGQRDYIVKQADGYQPERVLWIEYRQRWQKDLLKLLEKRREQQFAEEFRKLVGARESYYGSEFTRVSKDNQKLGVNMAAHVLSNLTPKQSQRFSDTLREWGEDFAELAAQRQEPG